MAPYDTNAAKSTPLTGDSESARNDATYNPAALNYNPAAVSYNPSAVSYNPSAVSYISSSTKTTPTESPSLSAHVLARQADPIFTTKTIAPSPPGGTPATGSPSRMLSPLDTAQHGGAFKSFVHSATPIPTPISASGLKIRTDIDNIRGTSNASVRSLSRPSSGGSDTSLNASDYHGHNHGHVGSQAINIKRTPSIKQVLAEGSLSRSYSGSSPNSLLSSPQLSALPDITPLPSPIVGKGEQGNQSPGMWNAQRRGSRRVSRPRSIESGDKIEEHPSPSSHSGAGELHTQIVNQKRRQQYAGLSLTSENGGNGGYGGHGHGNAAHGAEGNYVKGHGRKRSQSDYHPPPITVAKPRNQTVSGMHEANPSLLEEDAGNMVGLAPPRPAFGGKTESYMRREPHLAAMRGIGVLAKPPTPPSSRASRKEDGSDSDSSLPSRSFSKRRGREGGHTYFDAYTFPDNKRRRWRALKPLGEGTFSKVILATSQLDNEDDTIDENLATSSVSIRSMHQEPEMDSKKLVAIKICEHGPKGGASEERILLQLKRELELMKDLHHPSLIDLRAFHMEETRMILVLGYCAGGDLFDIASEHLELLQPPLVKRMFSEQVMAVKYLHEHGIVHRDVKLESRQPSPHPPQRMLIMNRCPSQPTALGARPPRYRLVNLPLQHNNPHRPRSRPQSHTRRKAQH